VIGDGGEQLLDQGGEEHEAAGVPAVDGLGEKPVAMAGLARNRSGPNQMMFWPWRRSRTHRRARGLSCGEFGCRSKGNVERSSSSGMAGMLQPQPPGIAR